MYDAVDWYDRPRDYELAFASLTPREVRFLEAIYDRYAPGSGRAVLEPACGAGRLVEPLAARGFWVTGFDRNPSMLAYSRDRLARAGLSASLVEGDLAGFDAGGGFELAHCLVNSIKYLRTDAMMRAHLRCVARALVRGGVYVIGLHLTDYADRAADVERWRGADGDVDVRCEVASEPPDPRHRIERLCSRLVVRDAGRERRYQTTWEFRTYSAAQLRGLIASVPAFAHVATYDFDYDANEPVPLQGDRLDRVLVLRRR